MIYYVCKLCNRYYKTSNSNEYLETCSCGNPFEVYSNLKKSSLIHLKEFEEGSPRQLIDYFIEDYESVIAKVILYNIFIMPNRLGKNKIIDILKGSKSNYIVDNNFNKLNTYSILADFSKRRLNDIIDVLMEKKYISINLSNSYFGGPVLVITKRGKDLLLDDKILKFDYIKSLKNKSSNKIKKEKIHPLTKNIEEDIILSPEDERLLGELKEKRRQLSQKEGVPAYVISNNKTLIDLAILKPEEVEDMLEIRGIGPKIAEKYGKIFLKIIKNHKKLELTDYNNYGYEINSQKLIN